MRTDRKSQEIGGWIFMRPKSMRINLAQKQRRQRSYLRVLGPAGSHILLRYYCTFGVAARCCFSWCLPGWIEDIERWICSDHQKINPRYKTQSGGFCVVHLWEQRHASLSCHSAIRSYFQVLGLLNWCASLYTSISGSCTCTVYKPTYSTCSQFSETDHPLARKTSNCSMKQIPPKNFSFYFWVCILLPTLMHLGHGNCRRNRTDWGTARVQAWFCEPLSTSV